METIMWENLHRIFVFFRYDIKNKNNLEVVDILIKVINDNVSNDKMCRMILDKMLMWNEQLVVEG